MVTTIGGLGTDETTWQGWEAMAHWPLLDLSGCRRAVVVAPHPDDEILGVGGIIASLTAAGVPVVVVAVTDGEASHPHGLVARDALAEQRTGESVRALADVGLAAGSRLRLQQPDGHVAEAELAETLTDLLRAGDWCLATWRGDGHPDHEAVGRAAAVACLGVGAGLLEFPIWTWHWAQPGDQRVPWDRASVVVLDEATVARKRLALGRFASQTRSIGDGPGDAAILPPHVLARFERGFETVFR